MASVPLAARAAAAARRRQVAARDRDLAATRAARGLEALGADLGTGWSAGGVRIDDIGTYALSLPPPGFESDKAAAGDDGAADGGNADDDANAGGAAAASAEGYAVLRVEVRLAEADDECAVVVVVCREARDRPLMAVENRMRARAAALGAASAADAPPYLVRFRQLLPPKQRALTWALPPPPREAEGGVADGAADGAGRPARRRRGTRRRPSAPRAAACPFGWAKPAAAQARAASRARARRGGARAARDGGARARLHAPVMDSAAGRRAGRRAAAAAAGVDGDPGPRRDAVHVRD